MANNITVCIVVLALMDAAVSLVCCRTESESLQIDILECGQGHNRIGVPVYRLY